MRDWTSPACAQPCRSRQFARAVAARRPASAEQSAPRRHARTLGEQAFDPTIEPLAALRARQHAEGFQHALRPVASTMQMEVNFCDTPNPGQRPDRGTIGKSAAGRDYRMSTYDFYSGKPNGHLRATTWRTTWVCHLPMPGIGSPTEAPAGIRKDSLRNGARGCVADLVEIGVARSPVGPG
jgi:hypothetical protein